MFQFAGFASYDYVFIIGLYGIPRTEFPHSDISGSMRICRSPKLIAACRVLLRLLVPRHSPYALFSLNYLLFSCVSFANRLNLSLSDFAVMVSHLPHLIL